MQRADLNPLEEAAGYQALANEYRHSQEDIAKIVGKSRSHVANTLRLLKLPEPVKAYINDGKISAGAARMLIGHPIRKRWRARSSSAGSTSGRSRRCGKERAKRPGRAAQEARRQECRHLALEKALSDALGLDVTIEHRGKGRRGATCAIALSSSSTRWCAGWGGIDPGRPASVLMSAGTAVSCQ